MKLYIKNMVCNRCIMAVEDILEEMKIEGKVTLGEATLTSEAALSTEQATKLSEELQTKGFTLLGDHKTKLVEQVKNFIVEQIHQQELVEQKTNWSNMITQHTSYDYNYLGRLFSDLEGVSIGQYIILQKIEKVKELMRYNELTLSEIAWQMGYSSVPHLSKQFKQITGMSPTVFKQSEVALRKPLDEV